LGDRGTREGKGIDGGSLNQELQRKPGGKTTKINRGKKKKNLNECGVPPPASQTKKSRNKRQKKCEGLGHGGGKKKWNSRWNTGDASAKSKVPKR